MAEEMGPRLGAGEILLGQMPRTRRRGIDTKDKFERSSRPKSGSRNATNRADKGIFTRPSQRGSGSRLALR